MTYYIHQHIPFVDANDLTVGFFVAVLMLWCWVRWITRGMPRDW